MAFGGTVAPTPLAADFHAARAAAGTSDALTPFETPRMHRRTGTDSSMFQALTPIANHETFSFAQTPTHA